MRTNQKEREDFLLAMQREGVPADVARKVLRHAASIQRLAVAECNGDDWRDPRGPRHHVLSAAVAQTTCGEDITADMRMPTRRWTNVSCSSCKSVKHERRIARVLAPFNVSPVCQGDPRGACVKLRVPSGRTDDWGQTGVCVPTPNY